MKNSDLTIQNHNAMTAAHSNAAFCRAFWAALCASFYAAFWALILVSFAPLSAFADWKKIASRDFVLEPPPELGSKAYQADFKALHEHQASRSRATCEVANAQRFPNFRALFRDSPLTREELTAVAPLLERVVTLAERIADYHKGKFGRPRPFMTDPDIVPCVEVLPSLTAYPSSHAATAATAACVLQNIFPDRAAELETYGRELGSLRVQVGVHHPSDVVAGQALAAQICTRLLSELDFQAELKSLKN